MPTCLARCVRKIVSILSFVPGVIIFFVFALVSRYWKRPIDVGLGPEPMLNNVYHKKALQVYGYLAETFVSDLYYITSDFDIYKSWRFGITYYYFALMVLFRYKAIYIYFNGGPLAWTPLRRIEPWIYKMANVRVLAMPYGGDVHDLSYCENLLCKHAINMDYPIYGRKSDVISQNVKRWCRHADHVISGCDWVYYLPRWDTLTLAHFSIDTDDLVPVSEAINKTSDSPIVILHAPNHTEIKGSRFFIEAIEELRAEGYNVELKFVQRKSNKEIRQLILEADIIADQLVIGWYAMFAIEGMAAGKPVLCYIRDELRELYEFADLIKPGELPIVNCRFDTIKQDIKALLDNPNVLSSIGETSRNYVIKHHSLKSIGKKFDHANRRMGITPSRNEK